MWGGLRQEGPCRYRRWYLLLRLNRLRHPQRNRLWVCQVLSDLLRRDVGLLIGDAIRRQTQERRSYVQKVYDGRARIRKRNLRGAWQWICRLEVHVLLLISRILLHFWQWNILLALPQRCNEWRGNSQDWVRRWNWVSTRDSKPPQSWQRRKEEPLSTGLQLVSLAEDSSNLDKRSSKRWCELGEARWHGQALRSCQRSRHRTRDARIKERRSLIAGCSIEGLIESLLHHLLTTTHTIFT